MLRARALFAASVVAAAIGGCSLDDVDLGKKTCPCTAPLVCDSVANRCVSSVADSGASDRGRTRRDAAEESDPDLDPEDAEMADGADLDAMPGDTALEDAMPGDTALEDAMPGDAALEDAMPGDAAVQDAMRTDAARRDGRVPDARVDAGIRPDARPRDASPRDALPPDARAPDATAADLGFRDAGGRDAVVRDASPDAGGTLALGEDCTDHAECDSRFCLDVRTSTRAGLQHFCSTPCAATSDCPSHMACLLVRSMGFCLRESAFRPPRSFVTMSGGQCTTMSNSCQSSVCNNARMSCLEVCTRESDCISYGGNCFTRPNGALGVCRLPAMGQPAGASCTAHANCASGVCDGHRCVEHCCRNADCEPNEICVPVDYNNSPVKVCEPRPVGGTLRLGELCTSNSDCEGDLCVPVSPSLLPPSHCTSHCCTNDDCAWVPGGGACLPTQGPHNSWVGVCFYQ